MDIIPPSSRLTPFQCPIPAPGRPIVLGTSTGCSSHHERNGCKNLFPELWRKMDRRRCGRKYKTQRYSGAWSISPSL